MNHIADISSHLTSPATGIDPRGLAPGPSLRMRAREFVGLTFFAPLLKRASDPVLKGKYGHGGRGEEVFRGQLNELLAMRIGQSGRLGLADGIVERMSAARPRGLGSNMDHMA